MIPSLERPFLVGQDGFWQRCDPRHVIVELTATRSKGEATDQVFRTMRQRGYEFRRLEGLYTLPWMYDEDLANWHFWKMH